MSNNELIIKNNIEIIKDSNPNTKIVINKCYGGFSLSFAAVMRWSELSGFKLYAKVSKNKDITSYYTDPSFSTGSYFYPTNDIERTDPFLVRVVEDLGSEIASGTYAHLVVDELPKGTLYCISDYDGMEYIDTVTHVDWKVA